MKKTVTILLCALLLVLYGCSKDAAGKIFRYDIPGPVENLDPQFATDATARMIIGNIYEGLVVHEPDGEIKPGVAERYTLSDDGLTYTFFLREGANWQNGDAVTAQDFVFTFRRMFDPGAPSPYAADYLAVKNAEPVIAGSAPLTSLGVSARDDRTLVIVLEHADPFFLELLAASAAMPCKEDFFTGSRGKYGLGEKFIHGNGPFLLNRWDNTKYILLRPNERYVSQLPTLAGGVNLYIGRGDVDAQFLDGKSDLAAINYSTHAALGQEQGGVSFDKTVWCIVFNQKNGVWGNPLLRQGLAHAVDRAALAQQLPQNFTSTSVFVPPDIRLLDKPYRDYAGSRSPLGFDPERGRYLFQLGLAALELDALPSTTLYVPDTPASSLYVGMMQQGWQQNLSAYINITKATPLQIEERLQTEDYQMLLMPFSPASPRMGSLLGVFASGSGQNYFGYYSALYDQAVENAASADSIEKSGEAYARAEALLLGDAVVIPLYFETSYYAFAKGTTGIEIAPFAGRINFKYGEKTD